MDISRLQQMVEIPLGVLEKMSVQELREALKSPACQIDARQRDLVLALINQRLLTEIKKHHWTLTPTFWVTVITAVAACIAAFPVVKEWISPSLGSPPAQSTVQTPHDSARSLLPSKQSPAKQPEAARR